jgi:hypothetical protein
VKQGLVIAAGRLDNTIEGDEFGNNEFSHDHLLCLGPDGGGRSPLLRTALPQSDNAGAEPDEATGAYG